VTIDSAMQDAEHKMDQAVSHLKDDLASIRTGRATPAVLTRVTVEYYGTPVPLNQLASVNVPEPRSLQIQPFDKNAIGAIEKAIQTSDLGITPNNDGQIIRLVFPQLTEDRRKELVKIVKHRAEEAKVAVRNVRRQARHDLEALEKDGDLSRDELERAEKGLEAHTHKVVADIDELTHHKEQELLEV
jgi:ribosome recycling factor